jgi:hypothetical protein
MRLRGVGLLLIAFGCGILAGVLLVGARPGFAEPSPQECQPAAEIEPTPAELVPMATAEPTPAELVPMATAEPTPAELVPMATAEPTPAELVPMATAEPTPAEQLPTATAIPEPQAPTEAPPAPSEATATPLPVEATATPLPVEATATPLPVEATATPLPVEPTATATALPAPPELSSVDQWSLFELSLEAAAPLDERRAYTELQLSAVFTGPDGAERRVAGFWDGGSSYRVRFTPTEAGRWSYSVRASNGDPGLAREGELEVRPAAARGFLRRDPANPQSFVFDDGTRFFMAGQTYYQLIRNVLAGGSWREAVDRSAEQGINKIRFLVYGWYSAPGDPSNPYPDAEPFLDGDHNRPNIAYWRAMDELVTYLNARGLVADVILFADDTRIFGSPEQDERYLRYILARYAAFPNVIWCLTNEWEYTGKEKGYWNRMGEIVRAEDPWLARNDALRPLSIHNKTGGISGGKFSYFDAAWPVHAIVQYGTRNGRFQNGDEWAAISIAQNRGRGMPVVNDEFGYIGETHPVALTQTTHRNALWALAASGGYFSLGDKRAFADGKPYLAGNWQPAAEYEDLRHLVEYWTGRGIRYWEMTARPELAPAKSRIYALAHPSGEVVAYAAAGGRVRLALAPGSYNLDLYNPRDGATTLVGVVQGPLDYTLPDREDWVLRLIPQQ